MKKLKIISLILMLCFVFGGCAGKNDNLKLAPIKVSASDFYHQVLTDSLNLLSQTNSKDQSLQDFATVQYSSMLEVAHMGDNHYYSVVSAMDFCVDVAENQSEETQKIYEYDIDDQIGVVVVNKQKGKSIYAVKMYIVNSEQINYDELLKQEPAQTFNYTVSKNKTTSTYDFSDSKNNINGSYLFDASKGKMEMTLNFLLKSQFAQIVYNSKILICNYTNDIVSCRKIVSTTNNGAKSDVVEEFLLEDYYKSAKLGTIKNSDEYVNLEKTTKEQIAVDTAGDGYGFKILYTNTSDAVGEKLLINPYGIFPSTN